MFQGGRISLCGADKMVIGVMITIANRIGARVQQVKFLKLLAKGNASLLNGQDSAKDIDQNVALNLFNVDQIKAIRQPSFQ